MAQLQQSPFSSWILTEQETLAATQFTELQRAWLQNQLAIAATEKVGLEFTEAAPIETIQRSAYLRGQLDILNYILTYAVTAAQTKTEENE